MATALSTTIVVRHGSSEVFDSVMLEAAVLKRRRSNELYRKVSNELRSPSRPNNSRTKSLRSTLSHHPRAKPQDSLPIVSYENNVDNEEEAGEVEQTPSARHVTIINIENSVNNSESYRKWIRVIKKQLGELAVDQSATTLVNEKQFLKLVDKKDSLYKNLFQYFCRQANVTREKSEPVISVDDLLRQLTRASSLSTTETLQLLFEITGASGNKNQTITRSDLQRLVACVAKDHNIKLSDQLLGVLVTSIIDGSLSTSTNSNVPVIVTENSTKVESIRVEDFYAWLKKSFSNRGKDDRSGAELPHDAANSNLVDLASSHFVHPPAVTALPLSKSISLIARNRPLPPSNRSKCFTWISSAIGHTLRLLIPRAVRPSYVRQHPAQALWWYFIVLVFAGCYAYGLLRARLTDDGIKRGITTPKCQGVYSGAKGFGFNLNVWCAALIALMCRRTLGYIRNTRWLRSWVPVDSSIYAHKMCAWWIITPCIVGHVSFHFAHFACLTNNHQTPFSYAEFLISTKPQIGWWGACVIFGWALLGCHAVIFLGALPQVRRSGHFEVFFWTHLLFVAYLTLLIMHSDKFWYFLIGPGAVYLLEKIVTSRLYFSARHGKFFIREATLWSSGVTGLEITKPPTFRYRPGDYLFINIPAIAKFEWHPFTISNAPENPNHLTLHVRSLGNWTKRLHEYMRARQQTAQMFERPKLTVSEQMAMGAIGAADSILRATHQANASSLHPATVRFNAQSGLNQATHGVHHLPVPTRDRRTSGVTIYRSAHSSGDSGMIRSGSDSNLVPPEPTDMQRAGSNSSLQKMMPLADNPSTVTTIAVREPINIPVAQSNAANMSELWVNHVININTSVAVPDVLSNQVAATTTINHQTNRHTIINGQKQPQALGPRPRRPTWQRRASIVGQRVVQRYRSLTQTLSLKPTNADALLRVYIDGPYGAPTSAMIEAAEHAVLVCAGIGVTPSAAILESLVMRFKECQVTCNHCHSTWTHEAMLRDGSGVYAHGRIGKNLRKVDFIWVVRSQAEVEWVYDRLQHIEREQDMSESLRQFITIHLYITSLRIGAYDAKDLPSLILDAALNATYEKQQIDAVTGLGFRANSGRPKWDQIFQKISSARAGRVTVFFCGQPALGKQLASLCAQSGFKFSKENF